MKQLVVGGSVSNPKRSALQGTLGTLNTSLLRCPLMQSAITANTNQINNPFHSINLISTYQIASLTGQLIITPTTFDQ